MQMNFDKSADIKMKEELSYQIRELWGGEVFYFHNKPEKYKGQFFMKTADPDYIINLNTGEIIDLDEEELYGTKVKSGSFLLQII
jgi:hypothetical protein